jgi:hypothetical protein
MFAFESLHPGHFIIADDPFILLSQCGGTLIQVIDVLDFLITPFILAGCQPIADQMRFEIALFLKDVRRDAARYFLLYFVGSVHRLFPGSSSA